MAKKRLYELAETTTPLSNDLLLIEDASTNVDKKVKLQNLVSNDIIEQAVDDWLDNHPEATTTVEDGSITPAKLHQDTLDMFDEKADIDGYYEDMSVGSAEQLLSNMFEDDSTPYLYRTSGGSLEIGDRVYEDAIVGGSIAWNQLVQNGNFESTSGWQATTAGSFTVANNVLTYTYTGLQNNTYGNIIQKTSQNVIMPASHLIYCAYSIKPARAIGGIYIWATGGENQQIVVGTNISAGVWTRVGAIFRRSASATSGSNLQVKAFNPVSNNYEVGDVDYVKDVICVDLTLALGSAIADYAFSLEQATAGSGIAWLKSQGFFTTDYYAYNAGGIESVKTSAKKVVGFNQWDEQYNVSGSGIKAKNLIPVFPNTTYYFKSPCNVIAYKYDKEKNSMGLMSITKNATFTTASNQYYMWFDAGSNYGSTTYNNDICINFHGDGERDGEYEAYEEHTYPLGNDELRGLFKLSNGKIYADGDVKTSDGTVTRKYGIVDLGTLTWGASGSTQGGFYATIPSYKYSSNTNMVCGRYLCDGSGNSARGYYVNDKTFRYYYATSGTSYEVYIYDTAYSDAATFKTAMSGVYLVYELATPTTESADPYTNPQLISNWGTEEFVDTRDVPVPVGHESRYLPDLKAKIESAPNNPSTNGDYLVRHNNGENSYVAFTKELPIVPNENGNYKLRCTVANNTSTLSYINDIGPELSSEDGVYNIYQVNNKLSLLKYDSPDYYGFIIHQSIASPSDRVEYIGLNKDYTPMSMGSAGAVNYGSWSLFPTLVNNKPAMVKYGAAGSAPELDYWLDESDYSKKADGTASDISNTSYNGGAFSWFEPIWMKVTEVNGDIEVRFAYHKLEDDYFEVCPAGCGVWLPMFYSGRHSVTGGKATSLAGISCLGGDSTATQWADVQAASSAALFLGGKLVIALYYLGCMWFKTTNSDAWGCGNRSGYDSTDTTTYGTKVNPIVGGGQFYATSDGNTANKFLHSIVLTTYDVWLRDPYTLLVSGKYKVSLDYSYDVTGATYVDTNISSPTAAGYPKTHKVINKFGVVPYETGGSSSTYYCDYFWVDVTGTRVALRFGACDGGARAGGSALSLSPAASSAHWFVGFAFVLKQSLS